MVLFILPVLLSTFTQTQSFNNSEQKSPNIYNIHDSLVITTLLQSNISSLTKFMNKWRNIESNGCIASYLSDGACDDCKIYVKFL